MLIKRTLIDSISFCQECNIYMCNKCDKVHFGLCQNHPKYNLDEDINEIFTGYCKKPNHNDELEIFCKNHNELCCAKCIIKIKSKGKGQHKDCEVFNIEDIKDEKKIKLKENIIQLEEFLNTFEESIKQLKNILEKINERKEELKLKIFTKIRNEINKREDDLLLKVDHAFIDDNILKQNEKLPDRIKKSIEKGKAIDNKWNSENNLISLNK